MYEIGGWSEGETLVPIILTAIMVYYILYCAMKDDSKQMDSMPQTEYNPEMWSNEKYDLYRDSLIVHSNKQIEKTKTIKKVGLGMVSFLGVVLPIATGLMLQHVGETQHFFMALLIISILVSVLALYFFMDVLWFWKQPEVAFCLTKEDSLDEKIIKNTENIAGINDIKRFKSKLLKYESIELNEMFKQNKEKGVSIFIGGQLVIIVLCTLMTLAFAIYDIPWGLTVYFMMFVIIMFGIFFTTKRLSRRKREARENISGKGA